MKGLKTSAVILGAGYGGATALSVIRSLGRRGVPVTHLFPQANALSAQSRYARAMLSPDPIKAPRELLELLVAVAHREGDRPILMCIEDSYVVFLSRHAKDLHPLFRFDENSIRTWSALFDKDAQVEAASAAGVSVPRTIALDSREAFETVGQYFEFPVFAKPRFLGDRKTMDKGVLFRERCDWQDHAKQRLAAISYIVQEVVPGPAKNICEVSLYRSGNGCVLGCASSRKLRNYPRGFGLGTLKESVIDPEIVDAAQRIVHHLDYRGVASVEFKRDDRDGRICFIEMNPRYSISQALFAKAGLDVAWLAYADLAGGSATSAPFRPGIRWMSFGLDFRSAVESFQEGELSLWQWAKSYRGVREEAFFAVDDPLPFMRYLADLAHLPHWKTCGRNRA